jgi:translation initiation factor 4G
VLSGDAERDAARRALRVAADEELPEDDDLDVVGAPAPAAPVGGAAGGGGSAPVADERDWRARPAAGEAAAAAGAAGAAAAGAAAAGAAAAAATGKAAGAPPAAKAAAAPQQQQAQHQRQPSGGAPAPSSAAAASADGGGPPAAAAPAGPSAAAAASANALRIQKASDIGRTAYRPPGGAVSREERALRTIKGVLNKLTPEKFERLLEQLLGVIDSAPALQAAITNVFENAVAQPTFCAMYADLCLRLSRELPSFPPAPGDDRPLTFKRVLLNTCQDEFEGAAEAREALGKVHDEHERAVAERAVKSRTLGTVRLIAELYRKEVVKEAIVLVCVRELLDAPNPQLAEQEKRQQQQQQQQAGAGGRPGSAKGGGASSGPLPPPDDNIEAACEMVTIAGKNLSASESKKTRDALDAAIARLAKISEHPAVSSRVRFVARDIADLKKGKWVPRRETFTAKKLEEVHAEAEAELGMVSSRIGADLPALPAASRLAPEDFTLLPPLRGGGDLAAWDFALRPGGGGAGGGLGSGMAAAAGGNGGGGDGGGGDGTASALVGDYVAPEPIPAAAPAAAKPAAAAPAAAKPAAAAAKPAAPTKAAGGGKPLTPEDVGNKVKSLLREYASVGDAREAATCVDELRAAPKDAAAAGAGMAAVVEAALAEVLDCAQDKEATKMAALLVSLARDGKLEAGEVAAGLGAHASQLEDLALDVPRAPDLLGAFAGACAAAGVAGVGFADFAAMLEKVESAGPRRRFVASALKAAKGGELGGGKKGDVAALAPASAGLGKLLEADELDGELPSVADFMKAEGLADVAL